MSEPVNTEKFDTCRFRSIEQREYGEKWCCGANLRKGYVCNEKTIFDLTPNHCLHCKSFDPRLKE
jgi:hypothetical protein